MKDYDLNTANFDYFIAQPNFLSFVEDDDFKVDIPASSAELDPKLNFIS